MKKITYVTALLNIKRDQLESPSFNRPFKRYLDTLSRLLRHMGNNNMVIYIEDEHAEFVRNIKPNNIIIKSLSTEEIRKSEYFEKIQKIRTTDEWRNQVGWLKESTQANLELYNPLIFQKIHWLDEVSNDNPFNSEYFMWVDAGIANAQAHPGYFSKDWFEERLIKKLEKFLFICFPYEGHSEIHGFKREGINKYVNGANVNRVARATFFGGKREDIFYLTKKFNELAHKTLDDGYMGTEESIYTIMSYLYSDLINVEMIGGNGLVSTFFENLQNGNTPNIEKSKYDETWNGEGSFIYLETKMQQNPKALKVFEDFFNNNKDIDLVIEIGSAWGSLSMFIKDQCDKINSKFVTYEIVKNRKEQLMRNKHFASRNIDMRICNIFDEDNMEEVKKMIMTSGRTLVMCDGGNKVREFNTISNFLKSGDFIMAHDYAPNREIFKTKYEGKIWNWFEINDSDINNAVVSNNLEDYHTDFKDVAWVCKKKTYQDNTDLYVVTFNAPDQFEFLCKSIIDASPEMFNNSKKYVLNNSTDDSTIKEYERLFEKYNFTEFRKDNLGICGGRQFIAEHFDTTDNEYMLFFEDDMNMNGPKDKGQVCKNGFLKYHSNLYKGIINIMKKEKYDFLKWSFTEFYGDNKTQWAWYNVPQTFREKHWPNKPQLPKRGFDSDAPLTKFNNIKCEGGIPYVDGEIYYCNWPQIVSKSGNKKMFLETKWERPYEQTWMSYMFKKTVKGYLKPAILLMSPITHDRFHHYSGDLRKES